MTRETRKGFRQKKESSWQCRFRGWFSHEEHVAEKALSPRPAQGRVKRKAWQEKRTERSLGKDKGYHLASHDSAPPSEDEILM